MEKSTQLEQETAISLSKLDGLLSDYFPRSSSSKRLFPRGFPSVNRLKTLYNKIVLERRLLHQLKTRTLQNDSRLRLLSKIGKLFRMLALRKWHPGEIDRADLSRRQQGGW